MNIAFAAANELVARIFRPEHLERLRKIGNVKLFPYADYPRPAEVAELLGDTGAEVAITAWGSPAFDEAILQRAPRLKLIAHAAGSVKPLVTPGLLGREIRICSANDALARGVAETTLGLTIVSLKNIWQLSADTRSGRWEENRGKVRELYGVTVGIVGIGACGAQYAKLLQPFDVRLLVYDPFVGEAEIAALGGRKVGLEQLLREADVVSIHAPSLPETNGMFNASTLGLMKDDAILINTARGSLIDEPALAAELAKGRLWACLDVTEPEPPEPNHPFRTLPNVTLVPHIAGATNNGLQRMGDYVVTELELYAAGKPLQGEVDLQQLHTTA
ncbi:hydroxyacid dehydrogenase [Paenibacillus koleovorans]|uniref:hydroxyacid dehydrogenase n=1 Tax=Paenibacillus koleovorans TaxID=121608 RepID=UPI000FD8CF26|nr:hydroxyacid dehydrogenase [Paenibacillus koleovorans]